MGKMVGDQGVRKDAWSTQGSKPLRTKLLKLPLSPWGHWTWVRWGGVTLVGPPGLGLEGVLGAGMPILVVPVVYVTYGRSPEPRPCVSAAWPPALEGRVG